MNRIDFSNPQGFPLEADATLGRMQSNYLESIKGLGSYFGNSVIVSGCDTTFGNNLSDGWIFIDGDFVYFEGGAKQATFYVEETIVSKANQNGTLYQRYFTRVAKFGTSTLHPQYNFADLKRAPDLFAIYRNLGLLVRGQSVIIDGCNAINGGISAGVIYANGKFYDTPQYLGVFPVYLSIQDDLPVFLPTTDLGNSIVFAPRTSSRYEDVLRRQTAIEGEIKMLATLPSNFDNTGLGLYELEGFAICNGVNGTVDLRARLPMGYSSSQSGFEVGEGGGNATVQLTIGNMPNHNHMNNISSVGAGQYGLIRRSTVGQQVTVAQTDTGLSGTEPDLNAVPNAIQSEGGNQAFSILNPYKVVVYIQKI